jgi:hypothetical protein
MVMTPSSEKWATREWLDQVPWNVGASFHLPKKLMARLNQTCRRADEISLSEELTHCFNQLDRKIFGNAHRKRGVRVLRFVALERTIDVGWHAHAVLRAPDQLSDEELISLLRRIWIDQYDDFSSIAFGQRLFWAEPITGAYDFYSTKNVGGSGAADWLNAVLPPSIPASQTRQ